MAKVSLPAVEVRMSPRAMKAVTTIDSKRLSSIVRSILDDPDANVDLGQVILKGGSVRFAVPRGAEMWKSTVWRRSGPIRPGEGLVDPVDIIQDFQRPGQ